MLVGTPQQLPNGTFEAPFNWSDALRASSFQIVSANTTTGFYTVNYDIWPYSVQILMLILMYLGGMAGSTVGGIKTLRTYILFKSARLKIESIFRPESVKTLTASHQQIIQNTSIKSLAFFVILIALSVFSTLFLVIDGLDPESALSIVACCINNVGFAFRAGGPLHTMGFLSDSSLILMSFLMITGRLEFFVILTIFVPAFWKKTG